MGTLLQDYRCLRLLEFAVLCPGLEASSPLREDGLVVVTITKEQTPFATLSYNSEGVLMKLSFGSDKIGPEEPDSISTVTYSDRRPVGDWVVAHRVDSENDNEPSSFYEIESVHVVAP